MHFIAIGFFVTLFLAVVPRRVSNVIALVVTPPIIGLAVGGFLWTVSMFVFGVPSSWEALASSFFAYVSFSTIVIFGITLWGLYFSKE